VATGAEQARICVAVGSENALARYDHGGGSSEFAKILAWIVVVGQKIGYLGFDFKELARPDAGSGDGVVGFESELRQQRHLLRYRAGDFDYSQNWDSESCRKRQEFAKPPTGVQERLLSGGGIRGTGHADYSRAAPSVFTSGCGPGWNNNVCVPALLASQCDPGPFG
jgi:hypothetical protein